VARLFAVEAIFRKRTVQTPVALTDGATITPDAALGNHFRVTIGGNRTLANPSNLSQDGQKILIEVTQDATGSRTLAYGTKYAFSTDVPQPVLTTGAGKTDYLGFVYKASTDKLHLLGVNRGFA
jgi:hypothetical protein